MQLSAGALFRRGRAAACTGCRVLLTIIAILGSFFSRKRSRGLVLGSCFRQLPIDILSASWPRPARRADYIEEIGVRPGCGQNACLWRRMGLGGLAEGVGWLQVDQSCFLMNEAIRSPTDNQDFRTSQRSSPEAKQPVTAGDSEGFEHLVLQQHRHHQGGAYDISGMVSLQYGYSTEAEVEGKYEDVYNTTMVAAPWSGLMPQPVLPNGYPPCTPWVEQYQAGPPIASAYPGATLHASTYGPDVGGYEIGSETSGNAMYGLQTENGAYPLFDEAYGGTEMGYKTISGPARGLVGRPRIGCQPLPGQPTAFVMPYLGCQQPLMRMKPFGQRLARGYGEAECDDSSQEEKHKWYPPIQPSILVGKEVMVRPTGTGTNSGAERITVQMTSLEDGYRYIAQVLV